MNLKTQVLAKNIYFDTKYMLLVTFFQNVASTLDFRAKYLQKNIF